MVPRPRNTGSKDLPPNLYRKTDARNGVTYYTYRDPISGRVFGLGKDKEAAIREAVAANHADQTRPALVDRIAAPARASMPGKSFLDWTVEYRELYSKRDLSPATVKMAESRLKRLNAQFGSRPISQMTTMEIATYLTSMTSVGKGQMARAMRSLLRDLFMEAIASGWCEKNPVDVTRAAKIKIKRQRLTLELWKATYEEARQPWLKRAMELAVLTGQRRDDIGAMLFKDVSEGFLHVIQAKTGARLRISTELRLDALSLDLSTVIKRCRDNVISKHLVHHVRNFRRIGAGAGVKIEGLTLAFAEARDRAAAKLGITLGSHPPSFHEMRSLAARLHAAEGRDPQKLLGHKSSAMTDMYRDSRGSEWIEVA
ncbi:phage integrase Arm DNA-binding domain-containing protein [Pseudomonas sp.]|uniref:phage integrase Arm DNA-binding domain-containing protein n=1 Tax=Pseudomonas sp. TaxID=306 RepID=UPI0025827CEB|nr:phage integrase Arm DNA-binding domain-containing protein [Pseudomonas sp.]